MERKRLRNVIAAAVIALASGALVESPVFDGVRGNSIDVLTALRWRVFGPRYDPATSPAVVVALDEHTLHTPPFEGAPVITWTREIGRVLTAILESDAKVVGFDIVFPTSIEQSQLPFDNETFGSRVRGFDREFLRALALAARSDKIVLGAIQRGDRPILPSPGQLIAIGQQRNVRSLNAYTDPDNTVRRVPLMFSVDGKSIPSMSLELAARALGAQPEISRDGSMTLAGYRIPSAVQNTVTLNFEGAADDIPTYSLADIRNCVLNGERDFLRRSFAGKVVLVGALLDVEDLKLTSKRFATGVQAKREQHCSSPLPTDGTAASSSWISGVYIHATAVNNLIRKDAVVETGGLTNYIIAVAFALSAIVAAFLLTPVSASLVYLVINAVWTVGATVAFTRSVAFPLVAPFFAGIIALITTNGFRFVVVDKEKRFLRRIFSFYLAPPVVEKLVASDVFPELGGETRVITVFFSDVAGFSSFSEKLTPAELVQLMNEYLSAMTDIIEEHGGFVDKYVGDAIVAVFGAPVADDRHAQNAVNAALRCEERLAELNRALPMFKQHPVRQRIGLNSGTALVGNIGSRRRFNYTAMGDTVNLASRLEGAAKFFGTSILAANATVALTNSEFAWREIDEIRVKGRVQPVTVFEPLGISKKLRTDQRACAVGYAEGLAQWRARNFAAARESFAKLAETDPASAQFLKRAIEFVERPPDSSWEAICTLEEK